MKEKIEMGGITLIHVNQYVQSDFWEPLQHAHDHAEIFLNVLGQMEIFVEDVVYHHNDGEIRIYAPMELHCGRCDRYQHMEWYQISLSSRFLQKNPALCAMFFNREKGKGNVFISQKYSELIELVTEILEKKRRENPLFEHYFLGNITRVLCLLNESENNSPVETGKNKVLQEIIKTINENYSNLKTLEDLCDLVHFSPSYIYRLFKKHLNTTPHHYISFKKLLKAKELLSSDKEIVEVCYESGFSDCEYFITVFKKAFGVTPYRYKKSELKKLEKENK